MWRGANPLPAVQALQARHAGKRRTSCFACCALAGCEGLGKAVMRLSQGWSCLDTTAACASGAHGKSCKHVPTLHPIRQSAPSVTSTGRGKCGGDACVVILPCSQLRKARAEVKCTEDKSGRPFALVITKQIASYDEAVTQHDKDKAALRQLRALLPAQGALRGEGSGPGNRRRLVDAW